MRPEGSRVINNKGSLDQHSLGRAETVNHDVTTQELRDYLLSETIFIPASSRPVVTKSSVGKYHIIGYANLKFQKCKEHHLLEIKQN